VHSARHYITMNIPHHADLGLSESAVIPPRGSARLLLSIAKLRFFTVSLAIHLLLVIVLGGVVLFRAVQPMEDFTASGGSMLSSEDGGPGPPPSSPDAAAPEMPAMEAVQVSSDSAIEILTTMSAQPTSFAVAPSAPVSSAQAPSGAARLRGAGGGGAGLPGVGSGLGTGGLRGSFFGVKSTGRHIAFLIDYSGSMDGPFREAMEKELERFLGELGDDAKVLIIPWSGGAWLHTELAGEIAAKWVKGKAYDDFSLKPGAKLASPKWLKASGSNAKTIMEAVRAQKAWSGGTDWKQPFRYAMQANPAPDQIFFMTDGQIIDLESAISDISNSLAKGRQPPQVTALWIESPSYRPDGLKALVQRVKGEFREVNVKSAGGD
jgi:hypothetical protein